MKIIFLHQYFNTPKEYGSIRSFELSRYLIKKNHKVEMITSYRKICKKKNWFKKKIYGIEVNYLPLQYSNKMNYLKRMVVFIVFAWKSYFKLKKIQGDIIIASSTPLTVAIPAILISKMKNIPFVFEVRDLWPDIPISMKIIKNPILTYFLYRLETWCYKNADAIVALSPDMKKKIISKKINRKKIAVIPNSSYLERINFNSKLASKLRHKYKWLKSKPLLIYTGTFGRVNNLMYLVELAKKVYDYNSNVRILLVGDGIEKKNLIEHAKNLKVYNKNLFFKKPIAKKNLQSYLSASNIASNIVIENRLNWSNSAGKFFDSLACGKPVFLNHGGWMHDIISKYNCGLCMHGKKIEVVAKELCQAITNKRWLKSSSSRAKKLAKKYFDFNIHAQQFEQVLFLTKERNSNLVATVSKEFYK